MLQYSTYNLITDDTSLHSTLQKIAGTSCTIEYFTPNNIPITTTIPLIDIRILPAYKHLLPNAWVGIATDSPVTPEYEQELCNDGCLFLIYLPQLSASLFQFVITSLSSRSYISDEEPFLSFSIYDDSSQLELRIKHITFSANIAIPSEKLINRTVSSVFQPLLALAIKEAIRKLNVLPFYATSVSTPTGDSYIVACSRNEDEIICIVQSCASQTTWTNEQYSALLEHLPVGMFIMRFSESGEAQFRYGNRNIEQLTGYPLEEYVHLLRSEQQEPLHPDEQEFVMNSFRAWLLDNQTMTWKHSYRFKHKAGHFIWIENYAMKTIVGGKLREVTQILIDVTEQKNAEVALLEALQKERSINTLKAQFVTTVSHEFRTPLTGILMAAEKLDRYLERMSPEQQRKEILKIQNRVTELSTLMDEFILQSSMDSLKSSFKKIPLRISMVCRSVIEEVRSFAEKNGHTFLFEAEDHLPLLHADETMIRHMLRNILRNAVKYSPTAGAIYVTVSSHSHELHVRIRDNGIGIPPDEVEKISQPFYRATNALAMQGSGMGLTIAHEFMELHKGAIRINSELGVGTEIILVFPMSNN